MSKATGKSAHKKTTSSGPTTITKCPTGDSSQEKRVARNESLLYIYCLLYETIARDSNFHDVYPAGGYPSVLVINIFNLIRTRCKVSHKVSLAFLLVFRSHIVIDKTNVGMCQHRVVVADVHKQTYKHTKKR